MSQLSKFNPLENGPEITQLTEKNDKLVVLNTYSMSKKSFRQVNWTE